LFASQYITPDTLGNLQNRRVVGANFRHDINSRSGITIAAQYSQVSATGTENADSSDAYSATIAYDYMITRELRSQLAYIYRQNIDNQSSPISSNSILATVTRDITILP
jgi:hypothetical protein